MATFLKEPKHRSMRGVLLPADPPGAGAAGCRSTGNASGGPDRHSTPPSPWRSGRPAIRMRTSLLPRLPMSPRSRPSTQKLQGAESGGRASATPPRRGSRGHQPPGKRRSRTQFLPSHFKTGRIKGTRCPKSGSSGRIIRSHTRREWNTEPRIRMPERMGLSRSPPETSPPLQPCRARSSADLGVS